MPAFNTNALPLVTINSVLTNGQTQISFYLSNYSTSISGYQIQLGNLPSLSNSTLTNAVPNWISRTDTPNQTISIASISLTPVTAQASTLLATYTLSQGSITQPISLSGLSLVVQSPNGPVDVPFDKNNFNFSLKGNVGFSIADNTRSGNQSSNTGFDTFNFSDVYKNYTLSTSKSITNDITTNITSKPTGVLNSLINAQRIKFADLGIAYDMNGNAGNVAKILGAVFGTAALNNTSYVGIGLSYLDQGMSYPDLIALALNAKLGANFNNTDEINLLYQNLLNTKPTTTDLNNWLSSLQNKTYTTTTLAQMACDSPLNLANVGLTGLIDKGLFFSS
jgi:hypothetical protein